jgi:hypothetical protein
VTFATLETAIPARRIHPIQPWIPRADSAIFSPKDHPSNAAIPAQRKIPRKSRARNPATGIRVIPARGGMIVFTPGRNFAKRIVAFLRRWNPSTARSRQASGLKEIRQRWNSTPFPRQRPR